VRVVADWKDVDGKTASTVTLETDARWTPRVVLTISGEVKQPAN
jgi:hypothetical protein